MHGPAFRATVENHILSAHSAPLIFARARGFGVGSPKQFFIIKKVGNKLRGMVCGMLSPGWPLEAARLAHVDGQVSHSANGVYGEMYAAVLTALAFVRSDPRQLLVEAKGYLPQRSEYTAVVFSSTTGVQGTPSSAESGCQSSSRHGLTGSSGLRSCASARRSKSAQRKPPRAIRSSPTPSIRGCVGR